MSPASLATGTSCKFSRSMASPCPAGMPPLQRTGSGPGGPAALPRAGRGALGEALSDRHGLVCTAARRGKVLPVRIAAWGHPQLPLWMLARQCCGLLSVLLSTCIIFSLKFSRQCLHAFVVLPGAATCLPAGCWRSCGHKGCGPMAALLSAWSRHAHVRTRTWPGCMLRSSGLMASGKPAPAHCSVLTLAGQCCTKSILRMAISSGNLIRSCSWYPIVDSSLALRSLWHQLNPVLLPCRLPDSVQRYIQPPRTPPQPAQLPSEKLNPAAAPERHRQLQSEPQQQQAHEFAYHGVARRNSTVQTCVHELIKS